MDKEAVVSVKLRPVVSAASYTDVFGFKHANAYVYDSEYQAGQSVCNLRNAQIPIAEANLYIGHPLPWSRDRSKFVRLLADVEPPAIWIQHETGPEILADIAALITVASAICKAFEAIRKKIRVNVKTKETDRHHKQVDQIRIESRQLNSGGKLIQHLIVCQDVQKSLVDVDLGKRLTRNDWRMSSVKGENMDWKTIGSYVLLVGLFVTVVTMFNGVNTRIDALNDRMDRMQTDINTRFDRLQSAVATLDGRVSRIEGWIEGRFDTQSALAPEESGQP